MPAGKSSYALPPVMGGGGDNEGETGYKRSNIKMVLFNNTSEIMTFIYMVKYYGEFRISALMAT